MRPDRAPRRSSPTELPDRALGARPACGARPAGVRRTLRYLDGEAAAEDFVISARIASSSGNVPVSSFDQIRLPSTKISYRPSSKGESERELSFCLSLRRILSVRLTALGS